MRSSHVIVKTDSTARDPKSGELKLVGDRVSGVTFSPDGKRLATASDDQTAKVWDAESGKELLTLRDSKFVYAVAFSPDGRRLATASHGGTVQVYALVLSELFSVARSRVTRWRAS